MTIIEAVAIMLGGGGSSGTTDPFENVSSIVYYQQDTTLKDCYYDGSSWTYYTEYVVPANSISINRVITETVDNKKHFTYYYHPFQLLINNLDAIDESVYGLKDIKNDKVYLLEGF